MNKVLNISDQQSCFRDIINQNIDFINRQCLKTVKLKSGGFLKSEFSIENEADKLFNRVLDKLSENDFRILRKFEGRSKITTYLTTIIARMGIDMIRERAGRERVSEKYPDGARSHKVPDSSGTPVREGIYSGEKGDYDVPDVDNIPELKVLRNDSQSKLNIVISEMLSALSGDEKLLLRMKFPEDPDLKPMSTDEISGILSISKKSVYNRIDRLIKKCRKILSDAGIDTEDFMRSEFKGNVRHMNRRE